jgi:uncharacterized membrane protein HdeD (DUF308 family)
MKILIGFIIIILGITYTAYLYKNRNYKDLSSFDKIILIRGYMGGVGFIILGLALICDALGLY